MLVSSCFGVAIYIGRHLSELSDPHDIIWTLGYNLLFVFEMAVVDEICPRWADK